MGASSHDDRDRAARGILHPEGMRATRELAIGIVHEINNALGVIMGNVHLATKNLSDPGAAERYLAEVRVAAEEARDIMRQLSSLTGQDASNPRRVSLNDLAHHVKAESARPVRFELSKTEPNVKLDLWLGQQALAGAVRFMSTSASVTSLRVATRILGKAALLTVEDDGATPNESELASAFAPFAKLRGRPRSCLGLTKLALMAAHGGGHVNAAAREPHGLRLVLTLPLAEDVGSVDGPGVPLSKQRV